jgi:hypothetical protein
MPKKKNDFPARIRFRPKRYRQGNLPVRGAWQKERGGLTEAGLTAAIEPDGTCCSIREKVREKWMRWTRQIL